MTYCVNPKNPLDSKILGPGVPCPAGYEDKTAGGGNPAQPPGQQTSPTTRRPGVRVPVQMQFPTSFVQAGDRVYGSSPRMDYNVYASTEQAEFQSWDSLPVGYQSYVIAVAKAMGHGKTPQGLWSDAIAATKQDNEYPGNSSRSAIGWILDYASSLGIREPGAGFNLDGPSGPGGGPSGGSGPAGPVAAGPDAVKRMMDGLSMSLIGRTLSDQEFRRYYGAYKSDFAGNPALDIQQHGTEALQRNDDYQEYQVAEKFSKAMQSVMRGAA